MFYSFSFEATDTLEHYLQLHVITGIKLPWLAA
jgi:hypothetical protein